jgi:hypothetical protein
VAGYNRGHLTSFDLNMTDDKTAAVDDSERRAREGCAPIGRSSLQIKVSLVDPTVVIYVASSVC